MSMFQPIRIRTVAFVGATLLATSCGGGDSAGSGSIQKALSYESKQRAAAEAADAKAAAAVKAKKDAEAAAEKAKWDAIDAIAVVPADGPKDLKSACDGLVEAYDAFMRRGDDETVLKWVNEQKGKQLGAQKSNCIQRKSVEIAACQISALSNAPPAFDHHRGGDTVRRIMIRCVEKFAPGGGAPPTPEAKAG